MSNLFIELDRKQVMSAAPSRVTALPPLTGTFERLSRFAPDSLKKLALAATLGIASLSAHAFCIPIPQGGMARLHEFYNVGTGHYFLSSISEESQGMLRGGAGGGWTPTGFVFWVSDPLGRPIFGCGPEGSTPYFRFYAPGPNTHVITANQIEIDALNRPGSGWLFDKQVFRAEKPSNNACPYGIPVQRFYNGRAAQNDTNHRYVANPKALAQVTAEGWIPEEIAFCAFLESESLFFMRIDVDPIAPPRDECQGVSPLCMTSINMGPVDRTYAPIGQDPAYAFLTGSQSARVNWVDGAPTGPGSGRSFVQMPIDISNKPYGVYLTTADRGGATLTSFSPTRYVTMPDRAADTPFFPFAPADRERELRIYLELRLRLVETTPGSHAYGMPVLEFMDRKSGQSILFAVQAAGTVTPTDGVGLDAGGKVIVATVFRPDALYGRNMASSFLAVMSPFFSIPPNGEARNFDFRLPESGFRQVIAAARQADARLSSSPEDYRLVRFELRTEVAGDGRIGYNFNAFSVDLINSE